MQFSDNMSSHLLLNFFKNEKRIWFGKAKNHIKAAGVSAAAVRFLFRFVWMAAADDSRKRAQ